MDATRAERLLGVIVAAAVLAVLFGCASEPTHPWGAGSVLWPECCDADCSRDTGRSASRRR